MTMLIMPRYSEEPECRTSCTAVMSARCSTHCVQPVQQPVVGHVSLPDRYIERDPFVAEDLIY